MVEAAVDVEFHPVAAGRGDCFVMEFGIKKWSFEISRISQAYPPRPPLWMLAECRSLTYIDKHIAHAGTSQYFDNAVRDVTLGNSVQCDGHAWLSESDALWRDIHVAKVD
jgi:hypothetical protein